MRIRLISIFAALAFGGCICAQNLKFEGRSVAIPEQASRKQVIELATQVRPSYRQLDYQQREMLGFIHIGMNTFSGLEWGTGKEEPSLFNPSRLDAEQWVSTFKDAGITGVILVAKHHDGFCAWPSKYTEHSVAHSPWRDGKGDLVREVADACRKYDMKLCIYLSPWDMHEPTYGTVAYNDYYIHQLEELLTNYGPIYLLWFDGAGVDSAVSGKEMPFDWERIFGRARELQPDVLLSGNAPDIRWVGNESGRGRETEWCVQGINNMENLFGTLIDYNPMATTLGGIDDLMTKKRLVWYPSRGGLPLRKGWFYSARDDNTTKSLKYLVNSFFDTVGQNANLLPNLSPNPDGLIPEKDARRLIDFGQIIQRMKSVDYARGAEITPISGWEGETPSVCITDDSPFTSWHTADGVLAAMAEVRLKQTATINVIKLQENVRDFGQRVEAFGIDVWDGSGWKEVAQSTTIGYRKMVRLPQPVQADRFRIRFTDARVSVSWGNLSMYYLEDVPDEDAVVVDKNRLDASEFKVSVSDRSFIFKLNEKFQLSGLSYLPEENEAGYIEQYAIYLSQDGEDWGEPVSTGRFGNIANNPVEQYVSLNGGETMFVKLEVLKTTLPVEKLALPEFKLFRTK